MVITNNINVATILRAYPQIEVVIAGGVVRRADGGIVGEAAVDFIRQFKVDFAVIGVSAIDEDGALLDFDYPRGAGRAGDHRQCAQRDPRLPTPRSSSAPRRCASAICRRSTRSSPTICPTVGDPENLRRRSGIRLIDVTAWTASRSTAAEFGARVFHLNAIFFVLPPIDATNTPRLPHREGGACPRACSTSPSSAVASMVAASRAMRRAAASLFPLRQGDLAGATSSASTKLIHGGLRYLEYYEFRLVHEALAEREVLLRAAPHIVRPLRFVLPHHKGLRPAWLMRLGLLSTTTSAGGDPAADDASRSFAGSRRRAA